MIIGLGALDEQRLVTVAVQQGSQLARRDPCEHGRRRDLVAVQMQDRQHGTIARRVEELVGVPSGRECAGLRFAVSDDARDEQLGIVEGRAECVRKRVPQLPALVDRARRFGRDVTRDSTGERELAKQPPQALLVVTDVRVDLAVGALEVCVGDEPGPPWPGPVM